MTVTYRGEVFAFDYQFYIASENCGDIILESEPFAQFREEFLKISVSTDTNYVNLAVFIDELPASDTLEWDEEVRMVAVYTAPAHLSDTGGAIEPTGSLVDLVVPPGSYDLTARIRGRSDAYWGYKTPTPSPRGAEHVELIFTSVPPG